MDLIRQCYRFREMIWSFARRELRRRFEGSVIGWPWPFIQPLAMLGVYYVVFVKILALRVDVEFAHALFPGENSEADAEAFQVCLICCALLPWHTTAEFVNRSTGLILENRSLVKKVAFPSELLPVSVLIAYMINLTIIFAVVYLVFLVLTPFGSALLWMYPIILIVHAMLLLGVGYLLATANVFIRDVQQVVQLLTQLMFFLTPIVYIREMGGARGLTWFFDINPMAYCVELYRWAIVIPTAQRKGLDGDGHLYDVSVMHVLQDLGIFALFAFGFLFLVYKFFMSQKHKFADEI